MKNAQTKNPILHHLWLPILCTVIFVIDLQFPLGVVLWAFYLLPLGLTLFSNDRVMPWLTASLSSFFLILDFFFSAPSSAPISFVILNRSIGLFTIWGVAILGHRFLKMRLSLQKQNWVQKARTEFNEKMLGEQKVGELSQNLLIFLAPYLSLKTGKISVLDDQGHYEKVAQIGEENRELKVIIVPLLADKKVIAMLEAGLERTLSEEEEELLSLIAKDAGTGLQSAIYRVHMEEQSMGLYETQSRLEQQQLELEHTNRLLEVQSGILESQRDDLKKKAKELEMASKYKSQFLANMSHELRTPLNSALILARLLSENARGNLDEQQVQYARTIESAGTDLLELINDILDLSKVEAGKIDINPETISLRALIDSFARIFDPVATNKGLNFFMEIDPDCPEIIISDRQRLEQILKNLLSNAFKFTEQGEVKLIVSGTPDLGIMFSVSDTGIGIDEKEQQVVFEAFKQADGTITRKYGGTGLGLSISRELAGLLKGRIDLESSPEMGSTFRLTIPAALKTKKMQSPAKEEVKSPVLRAYEHDKNLSGKTVLIADDDSRNVFALMSALEPQGLKVEVARDGHEALEKLKLNPKIDLILMDIMMPRLDGYETTKLIRSDKALAHLPVIAVTAEAMPINHTRAMEAGANDYLSKPIDVDKLLSMIRILSS